jgi:biopolymer transport protein ExbD
MIEFKDYEESLTGEVGPNLTPMIDMMFLLLLFFLLTSFLARPSIPVALPETETAEVHERPEIIITLFKDGRILLDSVPVNESSLSRKLQRAYAYNPSREVIIQADRGVVFDRVVRVMDISKKSGAESISFLVEQKQ